MMFFSHDGAKERKLDRISRWLDWIINPVSMVYLAVLATAAGLGFILPLVLLLPLMALGLLLAWAAFKKLRGCPSRGLGSYEALGWGVVLIFLAGAFVAMAAGKTAGLIADFDPGVWWLALIRRLIN